MTRPIVWSCGGGTQSAAIAALIVSGKLPKPDYSIIVDTEREKSSTWAYADKVLIPQLAAVGITLHRVPKSQYATCDLWSVNEESCLLPGFSTRDGTGKLANYCSGEWKREVVQRWCRAQGIAECVNWSGISVDEIRRARTSRKLWFQVEYPLIDLRMRRSDCIAVVKSLGWPAPPRSSCWMCPNTGNDEWRELKEKYPADFANAVAIEKEIQLRDPHFWLHKSCKPLDTVDFSEPVGLFDDNSCSSGYCFV